MDDLISRQAAIDQLQQSYNLLDAERRLEDLPSAQPEPLESEELDFVQPHKKIGVRLEIGQPKSEERTEESAQNVPNDELISRYER